jgi:hypothetical protein
MTDVAARPSSRAIVEVVQTLQIGLRLPSCEREDAALDLLDDGIDRYHRISRRDERVYPIGRGHSILDGLRDDARAASGICDLIPKWEGH